MRASFCREGKQDPAIEDSRCSYLSACQECCGTISISRDSDECFYPKPRELRYLVYNIPKKKKIPPFVPVSAGCYLILGSTYLASKPLGCLVIRISCHFSDMPGFGSLNQYLAELQATGEGL